MVSVYKRTGSSYYQARIKVGGELRRISTNETSERKAREAAERFEARENALLSQDNDLALSEAAERFFALKAHLSPKTVKGYEHSLVNILEILGDFPLRLLTVKDISEFVSRRLRTTGGPQIRQDLAFLSSVVTCSISWDCGVDRNVVRDFSKKGIPGIQSRKRWLTTDEVGRLLAACQREHHRRMILLAVFTGLRHQELVKLRWEEVDLSTRKIVLLGARTKSGRARVIPITDVAFDTLRSTPLAHRQGWVFPGRKRDQPINHFGKAFIAIRKRAKLPDIHIHDLRHTFASWWLQGGGSEMTLQDILGHTTRSMTKRYAHSSWESLVREASVLDRVTLPDTRATNSKAA